jgi:adenylate cyclase
MRLFRDAGPAQQQLAGQACQVTVLFADLEGFTFLAERLPPSEVVEVLNEAFTVLADEVFRESGSVDKFIGDAMLVVWATHEAGPAPDAAARAAARAALRMVNALASRQVDRLQQGKRPLKVRIGISSGEAIVGDVGCPARRDRTVIGDPVNLASRLEELNKDYLTDILVSEATRKRLGDDFVLRDLGIVPIKGRREPVGVYSLVGEAGR